MSTYRDRLTDQCRPRRYRAQGGFSLIEILIAMSVTLVGLAGLMSLYTTAVSSNARSTRSITASGIAQQTMEELRSLPIDPPAGYVGHTLADVLGGFPVVAAPLDAVTGRDGTQYQRTVSAAPLAPPNVNLVSIVLTVRWADGGADVETTTDSRLLHSMVLETTRTRQDLL